MRDALSDLLEKADLALGSAARVIQGEKLAPLIDAVENVRTRLSYPDDILVVAFAGGTGSGKSSLFNTLAGEELADVGGVRPTTSRPAAAVPASAGLSLDGYLDRLGVVDRHSYPGSGICLLDLPDTDSVSLDHRHRVDALLPLVDLVVWVVDPEKYRDARLHDDYLKPLSSYSAQFVFVLNQIDRLHEDDVDEVLLDLEVALDEDWVDEPTIVAAASPPSGPPLGLDELWQALESKRVSHALFEKLLTDLAQTSRALGAEAGSGLGFDVRADEAVRAAADGLLAGDPAVATSTLTGFLDTIASESGDGPIGDQLENIAGAVPAHIRRIGDELEPQAQPSSKWSGWFSKKASEAALPDPQQVIAQLGEAVIRPARAVLARRAVAVASIAELGLAVEELRRKAPG